jgi:hypothetical protein
LISLTTIVSTARRMKQPLSVTAPRMRIARPGARERLALQDLVGHVDEASELANLVLEELAQRLDELEMHALGSPPTLWWLLMVAGRALERDRLDDVRVAACPGRGTRRRESSWLRHRRPR